ncbi:uncharacterized protein SAPINGB_P003614 [Magnusiomyces paraingens]|uniref:DNA repair and recombination protein RAD52 n=1 Tax=Magnusiomyces paraingens TaxID=2606893 RepID=A0A5E8BSJ0_9ASCO|nr:uncharacterized protein SAPINGB_P003614 [Saprochaete ingens]VVT53519.1 unnamed protein product [Saprochaete ingens]
MPNPGDHHSDSKGESQKFYNNSFLNSGSSLDNNFAKEWPYEEATLIQGRLTQCLGPEFVSYRPAPGGSQVAYIEGWKLINLANDIFGFNGWSSEIRNINVDFCDEKDKRISMGVTATVRIHLRDGTFHEDVGFGHIDNARTKSMAFYKTKKEATTDGMKRALRKYGNSLGNCLYDNVYCKQLRKISSKPNIINKENLVRDYDFRSSSLGPHGPVTQGPLAPPNKTTNLPSSISSKENRPNSFSQNLSRSSSVNVNKTNEIQVQQYAEDKVQKKRLIKQEDAGSRLEPRSATVTATTMDDRPVLGPDSIYALIDDGDFNGWDDDFSDVEIFAADEISEHKQTKNLSKEELNTSQTFQNTSAQQLSAKSCNSSSKSSTPTPLELKTPSQSTNNSYMHMGDYLNKNNQDQQQPETPNSGDFVGFFKASVATLIQENSEVPTDSHFDPSYISPNMRRTLPHNKSVPILRSEVANIVKDNSNKFRNHTGTAKNLQNLNSRGNTGSPQIPNVQINKSSNMTNSHTAIPQDQILSGSPLKSFGSPRTNQRPFGKPKNSPYSKPAFNNPNTSYCQNQSESNGGTKNHNTHINGHKRPVDQITPSSGGSINSVNVNPSNPENISKIFKEGNTRSSSLSASEQNQNGDKRQRVSG